MQIIVRMRGGVGNQLFILAYAYYLSQSNDLNAEIVLDLREYEYYKQREFELLNIIHDDQIKVLPDNVNTLYYDITRNIFHIFQKFVRKETNSLKRLSSLGLYYGRRKSDFNIVNNKKRIYVYGYFQDAAMVGCVKDKFISKLNYSNMERFADFMSVPVIAVSIRCGQDYIDQEWPICSSDYYIRGINIIIGKKYKTKKINIIVFSDDYTKAKSMNIENKIIEEANIIYAEGLSSIEQLSLMSECSDFVISNSSFSWWGAYLGARTDSIVIMPNKWYRTGEDTICNYLTYDNTRIIDM